MHISKSIQKVIHALSVQLRIFEQIDHLNEIEHVKDDSVGLFSNEVAF